jgi:Cu/Ag efflux protein CusF
MNLKTAAVVALLSLTTPPAPPAHAAEPQAAPAGAMTEGEVRRVDKDAKKLTIRHGPIVNLNMPGMTMVFQVKDPALLDKVTAGDKIRFSVEKAGSTLFVTDIETAK